MNNREVKKIRVVRKLNEKYGSPKLFFSVDDIFQYLGEVKLLTDKQRLSKRWEYKKKLLQQHLKAMKSGEITTLTASEFIALDFMDYFIGSEIIAYSIIYEAVHPGKREGETFKKFIDIIDRFNMFFGDNYWCEPTPEEKQIFEDVFTVTDMNTDHLFNKETEKV